MTELMAWQASAIIIGTTAIICGIWVSSRLSDVLRVEKRSLEVVRQFSERLSRISALETPKGSATSKKMARIARGEE